MKNYLKKFIVLMIAIAMIIPLPMGAIAAESSPKKNDLKLELQKLQAGETAEDFIKNPEQPELYTLRSDYRVERNGVYVINYQPYVATVGEAAKQAEKDKVSKTISLPDFPSYGTPKDRSGNTQTIPITYDNIVNAAENGNSTGDDEYGKTYQKTQNFDYKAVENEVKIKHLFQDINDFDKYGPKPGETKEIETIQKGKAGSDLDVLPLEEDRIKGFVPEAESISVPVPQDTKDFSVEYRYNRDHFDVTYDTVDGTDVPSRTVYYGQEIPPLNSKDIPTKDGGEFLGWKPSVNLKGKLDGTETTFKAGELIKDSNGKAIKALNANLIMPASGVKFTAVWKDKEKSEYTVLFWTEKSDYPEGASLADKYDYVGTHVYKDMDTGMRPDLEKEPVKGVEFPDLDQERLGKIWRGERFNRNRFLFLNKFYFYNKELTNKENADPNNSNLIKSVSATGKTVYNIYYDRQVYDLYFTKSNVSAEPSFYPTIIRKGNVIGKPGEPYHFKARFNQRLSGWPNDAQETKGFSPGQQSFGWGPNFSGEHWIYRDTPPYRLSAKDFLDMHEYNQYGGYTHTIDAGAGRTITVPPLNFTTLSFGIKEQPASMPHHMDFWMEGFEPGEWIVDYDLYRTKADTDSDSYRHKYPVVQGFTPYDNEGVLSEKHDEEWFEKENKNRGNTTPYPPKEISDNYGNPTQKGKMQFLYAFFNNADEWGDPVEGVEQFETNGYIKLKYHRNKYKLRFNINPPNFMDDSEFNSGNQTDVFYQKPLKELNLDDPETLKKLNLKDVIHKDSEGELRVKKPASVPENMVFKGWSLDPKGEKLVWQNNETMPYHNLVLYAKWEEPDDKWKVTFDPNGGELPEISKSKITQKQKTILEGDISYATPVTYPVKGENEGDKQVFTVLQRQKLVEPEKPTREGYSFMGWEVLRYKKDANGDYTDEQDTSYHDKYKVPELYSFGNDVVSPIYLKAIWVKNDRVNVKVYHHFLDKNFAKDAAVTPNPDVATIKRQRAGQYAAAIGSRQNDNWVLASDEELKKTEDKDVRDLYEKYNDRVKFNNTYFQSLKVEPKKILQDGELVDNPNYKNNEFHFFYRPFRTRNYKVNYVDERAKSELDKAGTDAEKEAIIKKYRLLDQEDVVSLCRHYDARNYKPITGWKLTSAPQQQLFYDVDENTNEFKGINGTGSDEITFYYKDVRVIEVPKNGKTPDGYIRVTFKASEGGSFGKDKDGNPIKEINYDVLKGLKAGMIPVPQDPTTGDKDENKYYITPEKGKSFVKWDEKPLLASDTVIDNTGEDYYVFTAKFDWNDVVEQKGKDKPDVPDSYVKVIVRTTDKATNKTAFEKTFWVNPEKAVKIPVDDPVGKSNQKVKIAGGTKKNVTYIFKKWQKVKTGESDDSLQNVTPAKNIDLAKNQYTDKVTVVEAAYEKQIKAEPIVPIVKPDPGTNGHDPRTGDQARPYLYIAALILSATWIFILRRKRRNARNSR